MKKPLLIFFTIIYCFSFFPTYLKAQQESEEQLIREAFVNTLLPHIDEEISNYLMDFKTFGTYSFQFDTIGTKLLSIKRNEPNEPFNYQAKLVVSTFEHAHNPPHFKIFITLDFSYSRYKVTNFEIKGDDTFKMIESFYKEILADIKQSFGLKLETYKHYNPSELKSSGFNQIHQIVTDIASTKLAPYAKKTHPFKNVVAPITYLKEDQGYILLKEGDGTNIVYFLQKINDTWTIKDKKQKQGKKMDAKLLWYY
ncbi:DUF3888 domain-containing protein [Bacillus sp. HMF5848]|uniref:DUF3888 domain-containing protein n=1 Tax=Bacillus sp. HMF5848 TaxID=2495421 RepID=UPI000F7A685E|nr:DUF3888 domain-containing protein [Bacillus sp. HMF5848]RSK28511.1 DUF3888 domain-containing protein [Bacillus sp. HMF5848]